MHMNILKRIRLVLFATVISYSFMSARGQQTVEISPVTSTEGYEFFVTWMLNGNRTPEDKDLELLLMISSKEDNEVSVSTTGQPVKIRAGNTEKVTIPAKDVYPDPNNTETHFGQKGVYVYSKSNKKFTVYATSKIGTTVATTSLDASHLLPRQALGYEYVIQCNSGEQMATQFMVMSTT